jgi:hypothetical protein
MKDISSNLYTSQIYIPKNRQDDIGKNSTPAPTQPLDEFAGEEGIYDVPIHKLISDLKYGRIVDIAMKGYNGKYVVARDGGGGIVWANQDKISPEAILKIIPQGIERDKVVIRTSKGYFFNAEGGGGYSLNANKTYIDEDTKFQLIPLYPDKFALRTRKGYYVLVEPGVSSILRADSLSIGIWETFTLVELD